MADPKQDKMKEEFMKNAGPWLDEWFNKRFEELFGVSPDKFKENKGKQEKSWFETVFGG